MLLRKLLYDGKELDSWKDFRRNSGQKDDPRLDGIQALYYYLYSIGFGDIGISTFSPIDESQIKILKRFRNVFNLAYRRYNDIALAEHQAKEAQIETALERVRAVAMAMKKSDELKELIGTVHNELTKLDLILDRSFIMIYDIETMSMTWWMANPEIPLEPIGLFVKYHKHSPYLAFMDAWKARKVKWQYILEGIVKREWDKFLFSETELSMLPDFIISNMRANDKVYLSASFNNFGCLALATLKTLSDDHLNILLRFAKVFDLTYTRFNDLQKAESQAKEAQIETSLEKVRSSAMAMHKSTDISLTTTVIFEELKKLSIKSKRCGIGLLTKDSKTADVYAAATSSDGKFHTLMRTIDMTQHESLRHQYDSWIKQENYETILKGKN